MTRRPSTADLRRRLAHVRWIAGGTGAGKSTVTRALAERHDVLVYDGDRAEPGYVHRCDPQRQPHLWALLRTPREDRWASRTAEEIFHAMPSLHGETFGFVLDDLLALPADRPVLVDDFRTLPREVAPLVARPEHAVFLLPAPGFRARALGDRFADPARAHANWGNGDHAAALATRLARDRLWDEEVRRQARELGLPVLPVDGSRSVPELAAELAAMFQLVR
ncbi:hypothetical protein ABZ860_00130 [Microbispora sp. NPDC046973]|uniref:hypothetical protein n=1 Tax=Microbispora sp. NPDC046973 TaxID=3155022 RepID=UPI003403F771